MATTEELIDLYLDTFNYNGHTSSIDALFSGVPVITKKGNSFTARVCASILNSFEMALNAAGRLGLGTHNPQATLHVKNETPYTLTEDAYNTDSIALWGSVSAAEGEYFGGITWHNGSRRRAGIASVMEHSDADHVGIAFMTQGTDGPGSFAESMRLTRNGRLGIGTTNPTVTLDVHGSAKVTGNLEVEGNTTYSGSVTTAAHFNIEYKNLYIKDPSHPDDAGRQGMFLQQTNATAVSRDGTVCIEAVDSTKLPRGRIGGYGSGHWDYVWYVSSNAALGLPYGNTAKRPVTDVNNATSRNNEGMIRYNTSTKMVEVYTNHSGSSKWEPISCPPKGGTYVQLPGATAPESLWPGTEWTTNCVPAGCFIRHTGAAAASFQSGSGTPTKQGQMIMAHCHDIHIPSSSGSRFDAFSRGDRERAYYRSLGANSSNVKWDGDIGNDYNWSGHDKTRGEENRPDNVTVKF